MEEEVSAGEVRRMNFVPARESVERRRGNSKTSTSKRQQHVHLERLALDNLSARALAGYG